MLWIPFLTPLPNTPDELYRVFDPAYPGADARSATASLLTAPPPPGVRYELEDVPVLDAIGGEDAVAALDADRWHDLGRGGAGVKVAVFDLQFYGVALDEALNVADTHDCYAHPECTTPMDTMNPRFAFEEGVHGWGCAELVRAVAPEAELHLVRTNGLTTFENAVSWAIREEIDVISVSMSFFNSSFHDGTGPFAPLVESLERSGVLLVGSAGNYGFQHLSGAALDGDGDTWLELEGREAVPVFWRAGGSRGITLQWNHYGSCGLLDLDAYLYDPDGNLVARAERKQRTDADSCAPVERLRFTPAADGWYTLAVRHERGTLANARFNLLTTDGRVDGADPAGSLTDPGAHPMTFTVGAVKAEGYLDNPIESFSSQGPTLGGHAKPDVVGPDGVSVEVYGGAGFYGTSASTPAVAGAVALVLGEHPDWTPRQAAEYLRYSARGDDPLWSAPDPAFGYGRVRLPAPDPEAEMPCGRRPLLLPLLLPPVALWRRRRPRAEVSASVAPRGSQRGDGDDRGIVG